MAFSPTYGNETRKQKQKNYYGSKYTTYMMSRCWTGERDGDIRIKSI